LTRVEKSIEIKAPPDKVWEMIALDRWPEWAEGNFLQTKGMKFTSEVNTPEDKYRVGASAQTEMAKGETFKVTESLKNEKITYLLQASGTNASTIALALEPVKDGTKFTYAVTYEMPWGIFGKVIELFAKGFGETEVERSLRNLKSILEK